MANSGGVAEGKAQKPVRARGKAGAGAQEQTTTSRGGNGKGIRAPSLGKPIADEQPARTRRNRRTMRIGERPADEQLFGGVEALERATEPTRVDVVSEPARVGEVNSVEPAPANGRELVEARLVGLRAEAARDVVYKEFEFLSQGSCGVAYTATAPDGRKVLVKELHVKFIKGMGLDALEAMGNAIKGEGNTLKALKHSGIPEYVDMYAASYNGETRFYLVQEFKEGKTIAELVKEGALFTEKDAASVAEQLLEIMKYLQAFSPQVLHRDVNPNNVKLQREGDGWRVSLIDFGIAQVATPGTFGGTIVGTRGYAAPEQFLEGKASPASENYSVAATLLKMLTRKDITELKTDKLGNVQFKDVVNVTPAFAAWLERMLDQDATRRPTNAEIAFATLKNQCTELKELATRKDVVALLLTMGYKQEQIEKALGKAIIANATAAQQVDLLTGTIEERAKKMHGELGDLVLFLKDLVNNRDEHGSLPRKIEREVMLKGIQHYPPCPGHLQDKPVKLIVDYSGLCLGGVYVLVMLERCIESERVNPGHELYMVDEINLDLSIRREGGWFRKKNVPVLRFGSKGYTTRHLGGITNTTNSEFFGLGSGLSCDLEGWLLGLFAKPIDSKTNEPQLLLQLFKMLPGLVRDAVDEMIASAHEAQARV